MELTNQDLRDLLYVVTREITRAANNKERAGRLRALQSRIREALADPQPQGPNVLEKEVI